VNSHQVGVLRPVAIEFEVEGTKYRGFEVVRMYVTETTHAVFLDVLGDSEEFLRSGSSLNYSCPDGAEL
jgi:hypothetical protein